MLTAQVVSDESFVVIRKKCQLLCKEILPVEIDTAAMGTGSFALMRQKHRLFSSFSLFTGGKQGPVASSGEIYV